MRSGRFLASGVVVGIIVTIVLSHCSGCSGDEKPPERTPTPIDLSKTGAVKGLVLFKGTPPPRRELSTGGDAVCAQTPAPLEEHAVVISDASGRQVVKNALVWIKGGLDGFVPSVPAAPVVVDQKKCIFLPRVVGVQRYQVLRFTNSDQTEHNVRFAEPGKNPAHDKTMTGAGQLLDFWFPEVAVPPMKVVCSKHSWMRCWVAVVDHPWFAVTGDDGAFQLSGVPAGAYTVGVWTESFGSKEASVTITAQGTAALDFDVTR